MRVKIVWCFVMLIPEFAGCSVISSTPRMSAVELPSLPVQTFSHTLILEGNERPIDFSQFQPGSYCKLETTPVELNSANECRGTKGDSTVVPRVPARIVAGRIVSIDESHIVLEDAISISSRPETISAIPVTRKVMKFAMFGPLTPRLFKASWVGRETIAIPGEVTIERASIRDLQPVDGTSWDRVQNSGQWFERIGIDFDFNTPGDDGTRIPNLRVDEVDSPASGVSRLN